MKERNERACEEWSWCLGYKVPVKIIMNDEWIDVANVAAFDPKQAPLGKRGLFLDYHVLHAPEAGWNSELIISPPHCSSGPALIKTFDGKDITKYIRQGFGGFG